MISNLWAETTSNFLVETTSNLPCLNSWCSIEFSTRVPLIQFNPFQSECAKLKRLDDMKLFLNFVKVNCWLLRALLSHRAGNSWCETTCHYLCWLVLCNRGVAWRECTMKFTVELGQNATLSRPSNVQWLELRSFSNPLIELTG